LNAEKISGLKQKKCAGNNFSVFFNQKIFNLLQSILAGVHIIQGQTKQQSVPVFSTVWHVWIENVRNGGAPELYSVITESVHELLEELGAVEAVLETVFQNG
jgi:hypothetical protein